MPYKTEKYALLKMHLFPKISHLYTENELVIKNVEEKSKKKK